MNKYVNRNAALLMLCALSAPAIAGDAPITVTISGTMVPSTCKISAPAVVSLPTVTLNELEIIESLSSYDVVSLPEFSRPFTLTVDKASCGQTNRNHGVYLAFSSSNVSAISNYTLKNTALNGAKGVGIGLYSYESESSFVRFNSPDYDYFNFSQALLNK